MVYLQLMQVHIEWIYDIMWIYFSEIRILGKRGVINFIHACQTGIFADYKCKKIVAAFATCSHIFVKDMIALKISAEIIVVYATNSCTQKPVSRGEKKNVRWQHIPAWIRRAKDWSNGLFSTVELVFL